MFITHAIIFKVLVKVLFNTFICVLALNQQLLDGTGIRFLNLSDSSFMIPTTIWQWWFFNLRNWGSFHQVGHSVSTEGVKLYSGLARRQGWQVHILIFSFLFLSKLVESKGTDIFRTSTTIHSANKFVKCSTKVIINRVIFTKSCHNFLKTRFAVHFFPTCCFPLAKKWRGGITPSEGMKTNQCISVVFLDLNIWHSYYRSSCTSATIKDQIGGMSMPW